MENADAPVVVAVGPDGSPAAVRRGAMEAQRRHRGLHLVHATGPVTGDPRTDDRRAADAELLLGLAGRQARAVVDHIPLTTSTLSDSLSAVITESAAQAPVVVTGRRAPGERVHPQLRSATEAVAAHVPAPVLSVPEDGGPEMAGTPAVVVGVDPSGGDQELLQEAFATSRALQARLRVVTSRWHPRGADGRPRWPHLDEDSDGPEQDMERLVLPWRAWYGDVETEVIVSRVPAAEALLAASRSAQVVVLGRHEPWIPGGSLLGPVARAVLHEAACPVLLAAPAAVHQARAPMRVRGA